jgi:hypothetical protein
MCYEAFIGVYELWARCYAILLDCVYNRRLRRGLLDIGGYGRDRNGQKLSASVSAESFVLSIYRTTDCGRGNRISELR